jgi:hypothetical protein
MRSKHHKKENEIHMLKKRWNSAGSARTLVGLLAVTLILTCLASTAFGQATTVSSRDSKDAYYSAYFGGNHNAALPHAEVDIVNTGSLAGYSAIDFSGRPPFGDLCANIYVYAANQTPVECCSCLITPNALLQLDVDVSLTNNPANGVIPTGGGDIKIVSSLPTGDNGGCTITLSAGTISNTYDLAATQYEPTGSLREWVTHPRLTAAGLVTVTETAFHIGFLSERDGEGNGSSTASDESSSELAKLQADCFGAQTNQTGAGRCNCNGGPK